MEDVVPLQEDGWDWGGCQGAPGEGSSFAWGWGCSAPKQNAEFWVGGCGVVSPCDGGNCCQEVFLGKYFVGVFFFFGTVTQPLSLLQHRVQECSDLSRDEETAEITRRGTVSC